MIIVSNATPIISLASIGKIDILKHFFDEVYIPQAVYDEMLDKGRWISRKVYRDVLRFCDE